jgi:hypothetical protein
MRKQNWVIASLSVVVLAGAVAAQVARATALASPQLPSPPPAHQRLEDAAMELDLTPEQKEKVRAAIDDLQQKQRQLHEDFERQLSHILTAEQMQELQHGSPQIPPGPPGPPGGPYTRVVPRNKAGTQPALANDLPKGTVVFADGFDTDPRDHGRPVVLIAAALGVPTETFRSAFSGVTPAEPGSQPQDEQVRKNKAALLKVLQPLGIDNDRLDTVSNYYRYNHSKGEMWKNRPAVATAVIIDGVVTGIKVTDAGAGYSSPPTVSVVGYDPVQAKVTLSLGTDLQTNGSIKSIKIDPPVR